MNSTPPHTFPQPPPPKPETIFEPEKVKELIRYREGVETLLKLRSAAPISNGEPAHAAILLEVFFRNAKDHVRIFCNKLSNEVFSNKELVKEVQDAINNRDVRISIIVQRDEPEQSETLKVLRDAGALILRASDAMIDTLFNFAVMDRVAVRVEPNPKIEWKAQARMYDPELATKLIQKFEFALSQAVPLTATEASPACVTV
jgi:hypothetical protein